MDLFSQQFALILVLIPTVGGIVKTTVDMCKGAFKLEGYQLFCLNFALNFLLFPIILLVLTSPDQYNAVLVAKAIVGGWMSANWSAMQTDAHNAARRPDAHPADESE
jgi:hypothetical protein